MKKKCRTVRFCFIALAGLCAAAGIFCEKKLDNSASASEKKEAVILTPPRAPLDTARKVTVFIDSTPTVFPVPPHYAGIREIKSKAHFIDVVNGVKDTLVIFELYADWCMPCKVLKPVLTELAKKYTNETWFFKINVDIHPELNKRFRPQGIPFVVFVKDGQQVEKLAGVQPKEVYEQAILKYLGPVKKPAAGTF